MELLSFFTELGQTSISSFWLPVGFWTLTAIPLFLLSKSIASKFPQVHYHGSVALLLSLPLGFLVGPFLFGEITSVSTTTNFPVVLETVILESTQNAAPSSQNEAPASRPAVSTPDFKMNGYTLLGAATLAIWLLGMYCLIKLVFTWTRLQILKHQLQPATSQTALLKLAEVREQLDIKQDILLMHGPSNMTPLTFGWRKPVIVIPEEITNEPHTLETALFHELVHVKQRDFVIGLLARVIKAAFVFHPLAHILEREARIYRELSCDNEILEQSAISPANYARLLLRFNTPPGNHYSVSMISNKSILKQRIEALAHHKLRHGNIGNRARLFVLPFLLLMPAVFMACTVEQLAEYPTDPDITILEEIGMSLKLPEDWHGEKPTISYAEPFPSSHNRYIYDEPEGLFASFKSTKLYKGERFFYYTNVTDENIAAVSTGEQTHFSFYLHIEVFGNKSKELQNLWKEGKCKYKDENRLCTVSVAPHRLIHKLERADIPFDADSGFLYEFDFQYGNHVSLVTKRFLYHFYVVKGGYSYRIKLSGLATDPEKAQLLKPDGFLKETPFAEMLGSIQFH